MTIAEASPVLPPSPSLAKTKNAIDTLQEELAHVGKENDRLKKSNESKAQQLYELQKQIESQAQRLVALDGRLSQGQGALSAAVATSQNKEAEIAMLKQAITTRDSSLSEQGATVAKLERKIVELEGMLTAARHRENQLEHERATLAATVCELQEKSKEREACVTQHTEALQGQLESLHVALGEERARLISIEQHLSSERQERETERNRLVHACQARLMEAEHWLELAAEDAKNQEERMALETARQLDHLEELWRERLAEAVIEAREDERVKLYQYTNVETKQQDLAEQVREQELRLEHMEQKVSQAQTKLRQQVEACLEAMAERVVKHQKIFDHRQSLIMRHLKVLASSRVEEAETGIANKATAPPSPRSCNGHHAAHVTVYLSDCEDCCL